MPGWIVGGPGESVIITKSRVVVFSSVHQRHVSINPKPLKELKDKILAFNIALGSPVLGRLFGGKVVNEGWGRAVSKFPRTAKGGIPSLKRRCGPWP